MRLGRLGRGLRRRRRHHKLPVPGYRAANAHAVIPTLHFQFVNAGLGGEVDQLANFVYSHGNRLA
jgi:hypothetical protein